MPTPTPSPVMRVRLIHEFPTGLFAGSRFFLQYTDAGIPSIGDLNSMATFIRTTWAAQLAGQLYSGSALFSVIIDDVANATGNQGLDTTTVAGTRAGTPVEAAQVIQLNFKIGRHYRGGKPKAYLPYGVIADQATTQRWSNSFANGLVTAWGNFITAINGHTSGALTAGAQVSVSYYAGPRTNPNLSKWARKNVPAPRGTPVVDTVTLVTASTIITNLRKREGRP